MPKWRSDYDFTLRALVDNEFLEADHGKQADSFGWYKDEEVHLMIENREEILDIKLAKDTGNVSFTRRFK